MIHMIILSHFICITIGSILFYELLRHAAIREKKGLLVAGIGIMNVSFIVDTFNIYCRHWYKGYSFNELLHGVCLVLSAVALFALCLYIIKTGRQELQERKKSSIVVGLIYLLCLMVQILSNVTGSLQFIPWTCVGYVFFCGMQFLYLGGKNESAIIQSQNEIPDKNLNQENKCNSKVEVVL